MPDWTAETPLRVVTGYHNVARRFFEREGFRHVALLSADGALEAAPLMGCADIILDLVRPSMPDSRLLSPWTRRCSGTLNCLARSASESLLRPQRSMHALLLQLIRKHASFTMPHDPLAKVMWYAMLVQVAARKSKLC